jgi:hypothetical protein
VTAARVLVALMSPPRGKPPAHTGRGSSSSRPAGNPDRGSRGPGKQPGGATPPGSGGGGGICGIVVYVPAIALLALLLWAVST